MHHIFENNSKKKCRLLRTVSDSKETTHEQKAIPNRPFQEQYFYVLHVGKGKKEQRKKMEPLHMDRSPKYKLNT